LAKPLIFVVTTSYLHTPTVSAMKKYILLIFLSAAFEAHSQSDLRSPAWLVGSWATTNNKPGEVTIDTWWPETNGDLRGSSVLLRGTDTVFVEKMWITKKDGVLNFVADVPENKGQVYFRFTSQGRTSFVCENPAHDFPKKIAYNLDKGLLRAVISGGDKSIAYDFKKRQ
jgi:hypothetical protein